MQNDWSAPFPEIPRPSLGLSGVLRTVQHTIVTQSSYLAIAPPWRSGIVPGMQPWLASDYVTNGCNAVETSGSVDRRWTDWDVARRNLRTGWPAGANSPWRPSLALLGLVLRALARGRRIACGDIE